MKQKFYPMYAPVPSSTVHEVREDDLDISKYGLGGGADDDEDFEDEDFGNEVLDDDGDDDPIKLELEETPAEEEEEEEQPAEEEAPTEEETPADEAPAPKEEEKTPVTPKVDNKMVPRDRLNKEIAKRRELEAELEALRSGRQQPETPAAQAPTLDKAQLKQALENVLDGKTDDAAETLAAILGPVAAKQIQAETDPKIVAKQVEAALAQREIDNAVDAAVAANPWMDSTNEETFDADAIEDVIAFRDSFIRRGRTPVQALQEAVRKVALEYGYAEPEAPAPKTAPATKPKPVDIAKKVELAKKVPNPIPKTTQPKPRDVVSVEDMSDDDFDKLSGAALARARGDIL